MIVNSEDLLFRIRAETLRLSLERAHNSLGNLPTLSGKLEEVEKLLRDIGSTSARVMDTITDLERRLPEAPKRKTLTQLNNELGDIKSDLETAVDKIKRIEKESFLVAAKSIGREVYEDLNDRAEHLNGKLRQMGGPEQGRSSGGTQSIDGRGATAGVR